MTVLEVQPPHRYRQIQKVQKGTRIETPPLIHAATSEDSRPDSVVHTETDPLPEVTQVFIVEAPPLIHTAALEVSRPDSVDHTEIDLLPEVPPVFTRGALERVRRGAARAKISISGSLGVGLTLARLISCTIRRSI